MIPDVRRMWLLRHHRAIRAWCNCAVGFFVRQYKNSQAVAELPARIFVKYDGKDASKCAMRGLRGDALTATSAKKHEGRVTKAMPGKARH